MSNRDNLKPDETLMTHFIMKAPPPEVPSEVHARAMSEGLWIAPVKLSYDEFTKELEKIGDSWHLRDEHTNSNKTPKTQKIIEGKHTSIWQFMRGQEPIGFCCAVQKGFGGEFERISERFGLEARKGSEIYKVGLYPDFVGQGYGHVYLPAVQIALLHGQNAVESEGIPKVPPSDFIYLNTRLSNRVDSRSFYQRLGYSNAGDERWPMSPFERPATPIVESNPDRIKRPNRALNPAANYTGPFSKRVVA